MNKTLESFIDRCDELMIPAEEGFGAVGEIADVCKQLKKRIS